MGMRSQSRGDSVAKEVKEMAAMSEVERSVEDGDFENQMTKTAFTTNKTVGGEMFNQQIITKIPEVVDDFLRNFLRRAGLSRTLKNFEAEWYSSAQILLAESLGMAATGVFFIPDALTFRQLLHSELQRVSAETHLLRQDVLVAGDRLLKVQRERDFHRLLYRQVAEEKNRLTEEFKQFKTHLESYEPVLRQLDDKYQAALRQKMLINLKKDRVQNNKQAKLCPEKRQIQEQKSIKRTNSAQKSLTEGTLTIHTRDFPGPSRISEAEPPLEKYETLKSISSLKLSCSIRAHQLPISWIDLHPRKRILASASDDCSWRLWALPSQGEKVSQMILSGQGHSDWLSGCIFHPDGTKLATTSGDTMVRLWDFSAGRCVMVLSGHGQPTWGCSFHSSGLLLASCSADRTSKLWDLESQCCQLTLRGHTASVNSVSFLPFSNLLLTASADQTLSVWDTRLGFCMVTFHGHQYPCNHASFSPTGNVMASCDCHGIINLWDIRQPALPISTVVAGPMAANQVSFSPAGKRLVVACSDSLVRIVEVNSCEVSVLSGHTDDVQSVTFDHKGESVMSAGRDGIINIWSCREC